MLYIATLAEMKAELGIGDPNDDTVLTRFMEGLQGRFDAHCNRTFLREAGVTEYFDGGARRIWPKRKPIETVTSIHVDADRVFAADDLLTENDDFKVNYTDGSIGYGVSGSADWPAGEQNIRLVYTGGYAAGAFPEAVRGAFFLQCGFEWRNRLELGRQSVSAQGVSATLAPADFLPAVKRALNSYVRF